MIFETPRNGMAGIEIWSLLESFGDLFGRSEDTIFAFQSKSTIFFFFASEEMEMEIKRNSLCVFLAFRVLFGW